MDEGDHDLPLQQIFRNNNYNCNSGSLLLQQLALSIPSPQLSKSPSHPQVPSSGGPEAVDDVAWRPMVPNGCASSLVSSHICLFYMLHV